MRRYAYALALALSAAPALAHTGHGAHGFAAGLAHPLTGLDHLLATLGLGLWAGLAGGRARLAWPATFLAGLAAGFAAGLGGVPVLGAEGLIAASVILAGLAAGLNLTPPLALGAGAAGLIALAHGYAHGREVPAGASVFGFGGGFLLMAASLVAIGAGAAYASLRLSRPVLARVSGFALAGAGLALAWSA